MPRQATDWATLPPAVDDHAAALGGLGDGTPYFAPLGEVIYDGDERVCCHLCG